MLRKKLEKLSVNLSRKCVAAPAKTQMAAKRRKRAQEGFDMDAATVRPAFALITFDIQIDWYVR